MGIFDSSNEHPPAKIRRYVITSLVFVALATAFCAYLLRYHKEKITVHHFLDAVIAGHMQEAYRIYKPSSMYSYKSFLDDWGYDGYYGPVKSYHIADITGRGPTIEIVVDVSPYQPFPDDNDVAKQSKTRTVRFWVQSSDQSLAIAP